MNYIFPLLAVAITIGLFVLYAMVRQNLRRSRRADEVPHWPGSSLRSTAEAFTAIRRVHRENRN
ncbi:MULTISPECIES: hypothetical protein [unclassified Bradyrhizobium]|uniref:hypothetical protein n=1 Tax=unclassified Bradyrhizobium TaxID=2631580 RepID=UPI001FF82750|nr:MULTISPECIES: hypothetical protein [unclassified Bradyrhizobium]MCK1429550.1 hypothetical protein [Bradyrhizobium sp. 87]MCK1589252.1 hypothetical protein [Bradyrhizobium sp. 169]